MVLTSSHGMILMDADATLDVTFRLSPELRFEIRSVDGDVEALLGFTSLSFLNGAVSLASLIHPDDLDIVEAMRDCQADGRLQFTAICGCVRPTSGFVACLLNTVGAYLRTGMAMN
jgi:hypothetical protein